MNETIRKFHFGVSLRSMNSSLIWLAILFLVGMWTQGFDLFWFALLCGSVLSLLLRFTPWKMRSEIGLIAYFSPIIVVAIFALIFDERVWLKPLWAFIVLLFGGMIVGSLRSWIEVDKDHLRLISFVVLKQRIPFDTIKSIQLGNSDGGATRVQITFVEPEPEPPKQREQFLQFSDEDAQEFVAEVSRRAGLGQASSS